MNNENSQPNVNTSQSDSKIVDQHVGSEKQNVTLDETAKQKNSSDTQLNSSKTQSKEDSKQTHLQMSETNLAALNQNLTKKTEDTFSEQTTNSVQQPSRQKQRDQQPVASLILISNALIKLMEALNLFLSKKYSNSIQTIEEAANSQQGNRIKLKDLIQSMCAFLEIAISHLKEGQALIDSINAQYINSTLMQEEKNFAVDLNPNEENSSKKKSIKFKAKSTGIISKIDDQKIGFLLEIEEKKQNEKNTKEIEDRKLELVRLLNGEQDQFSKIADKIGLGATKIDLNAAKTNLIDALYQVTVSFAFEKYGERVVQKCTLEDLKNAKLSYEDEFAEKNFSNNASRVAKGIKSVLSNAFSNFGITDTESSISVDENNNLFISQGCIDALKYFLENEAGNCIIKNGEKNEKKSIDEVLNVQNSTLLTLIDFTIQAQEQQQAKK